jgi:membrane dipeptidase
MAVRLGNFAGGKMHIRSTIIVVAVFLAGGLLSAHMPADEIADRARKLHFSSIVLDTHDDTPQRFFFQHFDLGHRDAEGHIDIPRMKEGGLNAIFFSIWCSAKMTGKPAVKRAFDLIDETREQVKKHPQDLMLATTADDVRRAHSQGKIAVLMGVEGGHMMNNDLNNLRKFASLGVRYMTLTHTADLDWAGSSGDDAKHIGLSPFGKEVVLEMNRLGVMVDISHVSDKTFWDVLEVSRAPMIASHSSCRAICDAPRNMTDDMIKALAAKGGVIQINYHIAFLSQAYRDASGKSADMKSRVATADQAAGEDQAASIRDGEKIAHEMIAEGKLPQVEWEAIVDHIDHAVKLVGADHVGLGSDFDGSVMPRGMEDCSKLPKLTEAMLRRGYSEQDIRKILGGNTLRVMEATERVSHQLNEKAQHISNQVQGKKK